MKIPNTYIISILVLIFLSYNERDEKLTVNAQHPNLKWVNGVMNYKEIMFTGQLVTYDKKGHLKTKIEYNNGKKNGKENRWYPDGSVSIERFYRSGIKIGTHRAWWPNKNQKFIYHFNKKGEYDGNVKEWYKTKQLFRDFNYEIGQEVGSQRLRKIDGSIMANYEVIGGERFGLIGLKKCYKLTTNSNEIK